MNNYQGFYSPDPSIVEKKDLFRHGNAIGFCFLIKEALVVFLMLVALVSLVFSGKYSFESATSAITNDTVIANSFNTLACFSVFFVLFYFLLKIMKQPVSYVCGFDKPKKNSMTIFFIGFSFLMILVGSYTSELFSVFTSTAFGIKPIEPVLGEAPKSSFDFFFLLLSSAIAPALLEEFAFRGAILGMLKKFGDWPAIIISSILFSLMHGNFVQIPYTMCLGVSLALTRVITGSIWPCILVHFLNNAIACVFEILPIEPAMMLNSVFSLFCFVFGVISVVLLFSRKMFNRIESVPSFVSAGGRFARIFFSPALIISIFLMLITAFSYFTVAA